MHTYLIFLNCSYKLHIKTVNFQKYWEDIETQNSTKRHKTNGFPNGWISARVIIAISPLTFRNAFRKFSDKNAYSSGLMQELVYASTWEMICSDILNDVSGTNTPTLLSTSITWKREIINNIIKLMMVPVNFKLTPSESSSGCHLFVELSFRACYVVKANGETDSSTW